MSGCDRCARLRWDIASVVRVCDLPIRDRRWCASDRSDRTLTRYGPALVTPMNDAEIPRHKLTHSLDWAVCSRKR